MVITNKRYLILIAAILFITAIMTSSVFASRTDTSFKFTFNSAKAEMEHSK